MIIGVMPLASQSSIIETSEATATKISMAAACAEQTYRTRCVTWHKTDYGASTSGRLPVQLGYGLSIAGVAVFAHIVST